MEMWATRIPETGTAVVQAERAERAGWDGITFTDSQNLVGDPFVMVDVPLLYETGSEKDFDKVIVTACTAGKQIARLVARGLTDTAARQRLSAQWSTEKKTARADFVIDTEGSFAETDAQVEEIHRLLVSSC